MQWQCLFRKSLHRFFRPHRSEPYSSRSPDVGSPQPSAQYSWLSTIIVVFGIDASKTRKAASFDVALGVPSCTQSINICE